MRSFSRPIGCRRGSCWRAASVSGASTADASQLLAARAERAARVRAGALRGVQAALVVQRNGAGAVRCRRDRRIRDCPSVELADRVGLLLGEDHAAVGRADDSVRRFEVRPDELPRGTGGNDAWNFRHRGSPFTGQKLCERRLGCGKRREAGGSQCKDCCSHVVPLMPRSGYHRGRRP